MRGGCFEDDDLAASLDAIGQRYGVMPSELKRISLVDLAFNAGVAVKGEKKEQERRENKEKAGGGVDYEGIKGLADEWKGKMSG